jgi:hypothetical protein
MAPESGLSVAGAEADANPQDLIIVGGCFGTIVIPTGEGHQYSKGLLHSGLVALMLGLPYLASFKSLAGN